MEADKLRNVKLTIAYDGGGYHGWQRQKEEITTVQQVLEEAIGEATGESITVRGSGRTDTGVHAAGQVANFFTDTIIPTERLGRVIGKYLPGDIRVIRAEEVDNDFDAIGSAVSKLYRYTVYQEREIPLNLKPFCYQYYHRCDIEAMQEGANRLLGEHDFASFNSAGGKRMSTVRNLYRCEIRQKYHLIYFDLEANGFLYHMVRNVVGTLLEIGRGRWTSEHIENILAARDRMAAGPLAPANGLSLQWVKY